MIKFGLFKRTDLIKLPEAPDLNTCCVHLMSHICRAETRGDFEQIAEVLTSLVEFLRLKTEEKFK